MPDCAGPVSAALRLLAELGGQAHVVEQPGDPGPGGAWTWSISHYSH